MEKLTAEEVLAKMIDVLLEYLEELYVYDNYANCQYQYGEKVAYLDCLLMITQWAKAKEYGLDFDIEDKYKI